VDTIYTLFQTLIAILKSKFANFHKVYPLNTFTETFNIHVDIS